MEHGFAGYVKQLEQYFSQTPKMTVAEKVLALKKFINWRICHPTKVDGLDSGTIPLRTS